MEAKDLMIEDYLMHNGFPYRVIQVDGIVRDGWMIENGEEDCGEPIPITPELLEKNGFYYGYTSNEEDIASNTIAQLPEDDKGWCWDEGCGEIKIIFPNEADGGMIVIDDQSFDRHLEFVYSATIYVHELQHALRLCGIEKEIEL